MSNHWPGPQVKVEYCEIRKTYLVYVYGNPYQQVYNGTRQNCLKIAYAFADIGYIKEGEILDNEFIR